MHQIYTALPVQIGSLLQKQIGKAVASVLSGMVNSALMQVSCLQIYKSASHF
jgi:hypothetical protein